MPGPELHHEAGPPDDTALRAAALEVLESHWRPEGFTCPNAGTYPWLWLWDSCFHAVVWAELGRPDRALAELTAALSGQDDEGFVPHLGYLVGGSPHAALWGREGWSSITQPPVYGWAVAELLRRGVEVPADLVARARAGLAFLLERRRRSAGGLIEIVHPWESGCDHSPRWDDLMAPAAAFASGPGTDPYDGRTWFDRKGELLAGVVRSPGGAPLWNEDFPVGSVMFSAVTAWSARSLAAAVGDAELASATGPVADALASRWDPARGTWVDDGPTAEGSGRARTAEALTPLLVDARPDVADAVVTVLEDRHGLGGAYGPAGVDRREPTFARRSYWRGPSWPQIDLLVWLALRACPGERAAASARRLAAGTRAGAWRSGWAEYWDPDDATPGGAAPQSWTTVAVLLPADPRASGEPGVESA